jgi:hypothetical protein
MVLLFATQVECQEGARLKVAVIRLERLVRQDNVGGYDRIRLAMMDKNVAECLKKIDGEAKMLEKELLKADDEIKMADIKKRMEFLGQKKNLIKGRLNNCDVGGSTQRLARNFVIENYKDKYDIIAQDASFLDRCLFRRDVEVRDISEEAAQKFKKYLDKQLGQGLPINAEEED